jgi:hypothetical protein
VALKGSVIEPADGDMEDAYGPDVTAKEVLKGPELAVPAGVLAFPRALASYSARDERRSSRQAR